MTAAVAMPAADAPIVVHLLSDKPSLCPQVTRLPGDWPAGHRWARITEIAFVTCPECLASLRCPPRPEQVLALQLRLAAAEADRVGANFFRHAALARELAKELEQTPPPAPATYIERAVALFRGWTS